MRGGLASGLGRIGDFGLFAPPLVFLLGLAFPALALLGQAVLIPCVIILLAMSVGLAEPGRIEAREWPPVLLLAACNLIGTPILVHALCLALGLDEAGGWLVLVAACPAAGGAALVASLLRLPVRPLLLTQLLCFFALPLTAPLITGLVLEGQVVSAQALFWRMILMVGLPALLGYGLRLWLGERRRATLARPMRGLGVLALGGIALSIAAGLPRLELPSAVWGEAVTGLFFASLLGAVLGLLAAGATAPGLRAGFALGGAVRNVSLLWSATLGLAPPEGELVMMLGTLWTLLLPALLGLAKWRLNRREFSIAPFSRSTNHGQQRGMITLQFRGDHRTQGQGPSGAAARIPGHRLGGFSHPRIIANNDTPLIVCDESSYHGALPVAAPRRLGRRKLTLRRPATQAFGMDGR